MFNVDLIHFSRTLTSVHDKILEDLVFPAEIVGKRTRVKLDSSKLIKIHLDKANQNSVEHKVNVVHLIILCLNFIAMMIHHDGLLTKYMRINLALSE